MKSFDFLIDLRGVVTNDDDGSSRGVVLTDDRGVDITDVDAELTGGLYPAIILFDFSTTSFMTRSFDLSRLSDAMSDSVIWATTSTEKNPLLISVSASDVSQVKERMTSDGFW